MNTVSEIGPEEERLALAVSGLTIAAGMDYLELLDLLLSQPGIDVKLISMSLYLEKVSLIRAI